MVIKLINTNNIGNGMKTFPGQYSSLKHKYNPKFKTFIQLHLNKSVWYQNYPFAQCIIDVTHH